MSDVTNRRESAQAAIHGGPLVRFERVSFWPDSLMRQTTLGELRRFMREVNEWPDDAAVDVSQPFVVSRALPLATSAEDVA